MGDIVPITFMEGDPLTSDAQTLAVGHNAKGRVELGITETRLMYAHPTAFATYQRRARAGKHSAGGVWLWQEKPRNVLFMIVRESSVGATRLRYVQAIAMMLARDYRLYGIQSLAIAPLGNAYERAEIEGVLATWFRLSALSVCAYR